MKITDILSQKQQVDEAPVGMLKRAGLGIASKLGSTKASGALDMAKYANGLRKQFDFYLGQTDQKPNSDALIAFLKTNGFPTAGAEAAIKQAGIEAGTAGTGEIAKSLGADKIEPNMDEPGSDANAAADNPETPAAPEAGADQAADEKPAAGDASQTQPNFKQGNYQEPTYSMSTGFDKDTMKNTDEPLAPGAVQQKKKKESIGELSRIAELAGVKYTPVQEVMIDEVELKNATVDKIIKAAVTDILKSNMGQKLNAVIGGQGASAQSISQAGGDAGDDQGGGGIGSAFMGGLKRGLAGGDAGAEGGKVKGNLNYGKLSELLPGVDPNQLRKSITNYMSGNSLTREQMSVMATAFGEIVKMDPAQTTKALQLLKAVRAG